MTYSEKIVVGMTGPFGSGCTYISKNILNKLGYQYISLSDILRKLLECEADSTTRTDLQDLGNLIRKKYGNAHLAEKAFEFIESSEDQKFVIDSIRNTHEVEYLKSKFPRFFLFATWANKDIRWKRVQERYNKNYGDFDKDDSRDSNEKTENGQQITLCYQMADIIILNQKDILAEKSDDFIELNSIVKKYIDIIEGNIGLSPPRAKL